ncbi:MAG: hypothetical protein FJ253_02270, partial [Phycisphaerae bacterium]|nr:hypothetical protein [Phycisphaerae bacterium]
MPRTGRTRAGRRRAGANAQGHAQRGAPVRTLADLASAVERLSPCRLAAEWDRTGVLIGDSGDPVSRVLLTIDLTEAVLDEARDRDGAGRGTGARTGPRARAVRGTAVVAYHPPIFEPLANLAADEPRGRIVLRAARELAGVISPHTALDAVAGGVNDWLAEGIGAGVLSPIEPASAAPSGEAFLVCTKTPRIALDAVRDAMSLAGAGRIGAYSRCSFEIQGEGTFQGDASTNPAVGFARRFVRAPEVKLEMVSSAAVLPAALAALRTAHPYEEPAIEVLPLAPRPSIREGQGRVLELLRPTTAPEIASRLARHLRLPRGSIELVEA